MTDQLDSSFQSFVEQVRTRLQKGARQYGDRSFTRPVPELVGEIQEELADVCGWSFILWTRLERLRAVTIVKATPAALSKHHGIHVYGPLTEAESWAAHDRAAWEHHHKRPFLGAIP